MKVAIVGATGMVGEIMRSVLEERKEIVDAAFVFRDRNAGDRGPEWRSVFLLPTHWSMWFPGRVDTNKAKSEAAVVTTSKYILWLYQLCQYEIARVGRAPSTCVPDS